VSESCIAGGSGFVAAGVEPVRDLGVVGRDRHERVARQPATGGGRHRPLGGDLGEHRFVVDRVHDDSDVRVVLRCCAHHRRAADVDQLDARAARERIQVHHHEVDRLDAVLGQVGDVLGLGRVGEQSAVHLRVQRHHAVIEDRRHTREVGDVDRRHPGGDHGLGGTATAHDRPAELVETGGELHDPGLVVHGQQRDGHATDVTRRWRSPRSRFDKVYVRRRTG
jgi:hypothetical protein